MSSPEISEESPVCRCCGAHPMRRDPLRWTCPNCGEHMALQVTGPKCTKCGAVIRRDGMGWTCSNCGEHSGC